jgi:hypothetical protein
VVVSAGEPMSPPTHYVYDEPNKTVLRQGDILQRTDALNAHLTEFHPYYGSHEDYHHFMVVTQSCDLAKRKGEILPACPYITIAAVRPLEEALRREAAKLQEPWQRETKVISAKVKTKLAMFLESLFDNNKEGYFYLHQDVGLGIQANYCVFLYLSVALKAMHYPMCLEAKVAQLKEPFQAKLGYLIGHLYSRIGTTEWNDNVPDKSVAKFASEVLKQNYITFEDKQIEEGIADLRKDGTLATMTPKEIKEYIDKKKVIPRKQKFQERALEVLCTDVALINLIKGHVYDPLMKDPELIRRIGEILAGYGLTSEDAVGARDLLIEAFMQRLSNLLCDERMPGKREVYQKVLANLIQDVVIGEIMKG